MANVTLEDLWLYIYEHDNVRTKDLEQHFVETGKISRSTMYKYKKLLELEGKIKAQPVDGRPPYNLYFVPYELHPQVRALKEYMNVNIDSTTMPWEDVPWEEFPNAKQKVLWQDERTGAQFVLLHYPVGLNTKNHVHPNANQWTFILEGEGELPSGRRIPLTMKDAPK